MIAIGNNGSPMSRAIIQRAPDGEIGDGSKFCETNGKLTPIFFAAHSHYRSGRVANCPSTNWWMMRGYRGRERLFAKQTESWLPSQ